MKSRFAIAADAAVVLSSTSFAAAEWRHGERQAIWPEGKMPDFQEHQIGAMTDESRAPGFLADDHRMPYIQWCPPPASNRTDLCVILISGGGYWSCCDVGYVKHWCEKFTSIGVQCVNLVYRTPRPKGLKIHRSAWEDGQRAVRLVRRAAQARGFDPEKIGTISMSAGSHLATLLATSSQTPAYARVDEVDDTPCHINWAITWAIAYGQTDAYGTASTRLGDCTDVKLDPAFKFDAKTAPMCMFHGGADECSPLASTFVYRQLRRMKIPAELHLFADRPHGFYNWGPEGQETSTGYANWFGRAEEFLRQMGYLGKLAPEVPLMSRFPDDAARGDYVKESVWPEGRMPDVQTNQCTPYIEWHFPKIRRTKAIQIIFSGGSYMGNSPDGFEVAPARRYLNAKGMTVVTLKYRTPRPLGGLAKHVTAWQDLMRTVRIVRSKAAGLGLDPDRIGVWGSSAGGHLALMAATSSRHPYYRPVDNIDRTVSAKVQWAVAIYPAYSLTDGAERPNKTGGNDDSARLVPDFSFDLDTCPIVFVHGDGDGWAAMNSVKAWEQLRRMGVQGDLHTLAKRPHCFQRAASPGTGSYTWLDRVWEFLNHKGFNRPVSPGEGG